MMDMRLYFIGGLIGGFVSDDVEVARDLEEFYFEVVILEIISF